MQIVWLRDTSEVINDKLYKKDLLGTYWDMNAWMKNVAKEGNVEFPNSKKPEHTVSLPCRTQAATIVVPMPRRSGSAHARS